MALPLKVHAQTYLPSQEPGHEGQAFQVPPGVLPQQYSNRLPQIEPGGTHYNFDQPWNYNGMRTYVMPVPIYNGPQTSQPMYSSHY